MKILVKELDRDGHALAYLRNQFPKLSEAKEKERMIIGSLIREVIHDPDFRSTLSCAEKTPWTTFKSLCTKSIWIHKAENYREIVNEKSNCFQVVKCNMSLKLHFLDYHLEFFPQYLGDVSDEHGDIYSRYFGHGNRVIGNMSLWCA